MTARAGADTFALLSPPAVLSADERTRSAGGAVTSAVNDTNGKVALSAAGHAWALQRVSLVVAAVVLHSACAAGRGAGPRNARCSTKLPTPHTALHGAVPLPSLVAAAQSVKVHCERAVTGVTDGDVVADEVAVTDRVAVALALGLQEPEALRVAVADCSGMWRERGEGMDG
jgi:hypothetical protein